MPEFTQVLANKLATVPWSTKVMSGPGSNAGEACYFFKYFSDDSENLCCFLITDTITVWAEVLDSKYTSHRARHAHSARGSARPKRGFALPYHDADEETEWRRGVVKVLGEVHEGAMDGIIELEIRDSEMSDMSVYVSDTIRDFHWRWDVMSVRNMAGSILSKQLFMPLVTLATVTSSLGQTVDDASEETLRTVAERKASTAKAMPTHHLRGFFSRSPIRTLLSCIAQVEGASKPNFALENSKQSSMMSVDMADTTTENVQNHSDPGARPLIRSSSDGLGRSVGPGSSRKGKGRDSTDDENEGSARKIQRGAAPRRSNILPTESGAATTLFSKAGIPQDDSDLTASEDETDPAPSKNVANSSYSRTIDEDDISVPFPQSPRPQPSTPKPAMLPTRRTVEKPKSGRAPPPPDNSNVFGATQTQTQASSDDSDREAELERRVRAAGAIGSAAVRTPAGGGLGSRMIRKKF